MGIVDGEYAPGDRVELAIERMAHGGEAVGRAGDGRVVFVDGGLPGEEVVALLEDVQPRFARARMVEAAVAPSPDRVVPRCPFFGAWPERGQNPAGHCGACQWQHADYAAQLTFKERILRDALERIGRFADPPVRSALPSPQPWAYRNHIRLRGVGRGVGYVAADGSSLLAIDECPIAHPLVAALIPLVAESVGEGAEVSLRAGTRTGSQMIVFHAEPEDYEGIEVEADVSVAICSAEGACAVAAGDPYVVEEISGRGFLVPPDAFFQVNTDVAEALVGELRREVGERVGTLLDVHSGVGTFGILLADLADEVWSIENHRASVAAAVENATGLDHMTLLEADAAEGLMHLDRAADVTIVDPPRTGLERQVIRLLCEKPPATLLYVSCDPPTLARDARQLVDSGFSLESSLPVDMFPQTFHVESLTVFKRPASAGSNGHRSGDTA